MKIVNSVRNLLLIVIGFQITFEPMAMAAGAQKSNVAVVKEFLKSSGLTNKKISVGEFYRKTSPNFPEVVRNAYHPYAVLLQDEMMPSIEPVVFVDNQKTEQVRLIINWDKKTYSLQTEGFGENLKLRFNNSLLGSTELGNPYVVFKKIVEEVGPTNFKTKSVSDVKVTPTRDQWKKMSGLQRLQYLVMFRYLLEDVQKINPPTLNSASFDVSNPLEKFSLIFEMLSPEACANNMAGKPCVIAGWPSVYGDKNPPRCAGRDTGFNDLFVRVKEQWRKSSYQGPATCVDNGEVPCNPLIYGFSSDKNPHCVSRSAAVIKYATRDVCKDKSPLRHDKDDKPLTKEQEVANIKRIIDSHFSAQGKSVNTKVENNEILASEADYNLIKDYVDSMDSAINEAVWACGQNPLPDQKIACEELSKRRISMASFRMIPPTPAPQNSTQAATQVADMSACAANPLHGNCPGDPLPRIEIPDRKPIQGIDLTKDQPKPPTRDIHDETGTPKVEDIPEKGICEGDRKDKCIGTALVVGSVFAMWYIIKQSNKKQPGNSLNPIVPNSSPGGLPPPGGNTGSNPAPVAPPPPSESASGSGTGTPPPAGGTRKPGQK